MGTSNRNDIFRSKREMYAKNYTTGEQLRVARAELTHETGAAPGVAVFNGSYLVFAITADHTYKLAGALADVIDGLPRDATA